MVIGAIAFAASSAPALATSLGRMGGSLSPAIPPSDRDVLTIEPDGSGVLNVTGVSGAPGFAVEPDYSPNGTKIAFRAGATTAAEIYTANAAGTGFSRLTGPNSFKDYTHPGDDQAHARQPARGSAGLLPDGTKITLESNFYACNAGTTDCRTEIFVMNANGGSITQLTDKDGNNADPTWSPQGNKLVFARSKGATFNNQQVYTMNPDGTGITRVTQTNDESFGPDWGVR